MNGINRFAGIINKIKILAFYFVLYLNIQYQDYENSRIDVFEIYKALIVFKYANSCIISNYNVGF